jgi:hypothetical protein
VHRAPLGNDHDNRWLFGKNLIAILHVKDVLVLDMGMFTLLNLIMFVICEVTIGVILNYTCHDFVSILTSLKKEECVLCKHLCFIYRTTTTIGGYSAIQISSQTTKKEVSENPLLRTIIPHKLLSFCDTITFAPGQSQVLHNSRT